MAFHQAHKKALNLVNASSQGPLRVPRKKTWLTLKTPETSSSVLLDSLVALVEVSEVHKGVTRVPPQNLLEALWDLNQMFKED